MWCFSKPQFSLPQNCGSFFVAPLQVSRVGLRDAPNEERICATDLSRQAMMSGFLSQTEQVSQVDKLRDTLYMELCEDVRPVLGYGFCTDCEFTADLFG